VNANSIYFFNLFREVPIIAQKKGEQLINEQIKVAQLMVIGPNGEQMGVKNLDDALTLASYAGLDLVLMSSGSESSPAVGKIMDYNKYKYEKKKKLKQQQKQQRENTKELKEYRFSIKIEIGDFNTRVKNAQNYLVKGHKIKGSLRFKGREMNHIEDGKKVLLRFAESLSEYSSIEQPPKLEGKNMTIILTPKK